MADKSLAQWLSWLETLHPSAIDLGLERVQAVARQLGLNSNGATVITVAGTNGKGSTIAALAALLGEHNTASLESSNSARRLGIYTSPHLLRFNERIVIDGVEARDEAICLALLEVEQARCQTFLNQAAEPVTLSYFEFTTLAALLLFQRAGLDYWLLEVGLGGRLDAVNIIDPDIAVITQLGLDHQHYLGETLAQIAAEKAGILRRGIPVVIADPNPPETLLAIAANLDCRIHLASEAVPETVQANCGQLHPLSWWAAVETGRLLGLQLSSAQLSRLQQTTTLSGRQMRIDWQGRQWLLDVAHNPASVEYLASVLASESAPSLTVAAIMGDKAIAEMLSLLAGYVHEWFFCDLPDTARAASAIELGAHWQTICDRGEADSAIPVKYFSNIKTALNCAVQQTSAGDKILVFGSFYTVAAALEVIGHASCAEDEDRRRKR